ncbi:hypothetical protein GNP61_19595 [Aliivibrio fischeri]|nr:hypothetical protein [Aliivibrio fischeri]MUK43745.1 hypothetical protein [Aliivibrio fischeri]
MRRKLSRDKLLKWLKSVSGVILTSVIFVKDVNSINLTSFSPKFLAAAMEANFTTFPKGQYVVSYEKAEEMDNDDFEPSSCIWTTAYNAHVNGGGKIENLSNLILALADYEYCIASNKGNELSAYQLGSLYVKKPIHPEEMEKLLVIIKKHTSFAFFDGANFNNGSTYVNGKRFT